MIKTPAELAEPYAQETLDFFRASVPEAVTNHDLRTYHYAEFLVDHWDLRDHKEYDPQAVFFATILHDLGLSRAGAERPDRFEVAGADLAGEYLQKMGIDQRTVEVVWEAIAMHTSIGIAERLGLVAQLTVAATGLDFGANSEFVTDEMAADLHARYPRLQVSSALHSGIVEPARRNPAKAPLGSLTDFLIKAENAGIDPGIGSRWSD